MDTKSAAAALEALGSEQRLGIYRLLVRSGPSGMSVGEVRDRLDIPASTLSHHLAKLVQHELVLQRRESRNLICECNYGQMEALIAFLAENCCADSCCDEPGATQAC